MVHVDAVIVFCDIAIKNLDRGAVPIVRAALEDLMKKCEKEKLKKSKKYQIPDLPLQQFDNIKIRVLAQKINEIIKDRNERFN